MFLERAAGAQITPVPSGLLSSLAKRPGIEPFSIGAGPGLDRANATDIIAPLEWPDSKARLGVRRTMSPKTMGSFPLRAQYHENAGHHSRPPLGAHRRA